MKTTLAGPSPARVSSPQSEPAEEAQPSNEVAARSAAPDAFDEGRACATPEAPAQVVAAATQRAEEILKERSDGAAPNARVDRTIDVHFNVISDGTAATEVSQKQIDEQIQTLNDAYAPLGIGFKLASVKETKNKKWAHAGPGTVAERQMKEKLRQGDRDDLNIYTTVPPKKLLGWATFPWEQADSPDQDGVVVAASSLPEGPKPPYNEGDTLTHEVGHWMGLLHTFQGPSDAVSDTPFHQVNFGQDPDGTDSDPRPGTDPVHNFMNYTQDDWMNEFTPGQVDRMRTMFAAYRSEEVAPLFPRPQLLEGYDLSLGAGTSTTVQGVMPDGGVTHVNDEGVDAGSIVRVNYRPDFNALGVDANDIASTKMHTMVDGETETTDVPWTKDASGNPEPEPVGFQVPYETDSEAQIWFENQLRDGRTVWDSQNGNNYHLNILPPFGSTLLFGENWASVADAKPIAGGSLNLSYDVDRIHEFMQGSGSRRIDAYVSFDGRDPVVSTIAEQDGNGQPRVLTPTVQIPNDAKHLSVWFKATTDGGASWDSNFGNNYQFDVAAP